MTPEELLTIGLIIVGLAVLVFSLWVLITVLDAARQAAEYFHRENGRHRQRIENRE